MKRGIIYLMLVFAAILQMGCDNGSDGGGDGDFAVVITKPQLPVNAGATVTLDASATTHTGDGVTITGFSWVQKTGTSVTLQSADTAIATFVAPNVANNTDLIFDVTITASNGKSTTRTTTVTVVGTNQPPIANAGDPRSVNSGASVSLNGSGSSDPDAGDSIASYSWTQTGGATVSLQNADTATASFTAPTVTSATTLTFQLTVTDTNNAQDTATVTITVNPAPPPQGPYVPITRTDSNNDFVSLDVIDTMNPSNIITVDQTVYTYFHQFVQYEYDQATQTISNGQPKYMLYLSNGHFWRVSLAAGSDLIPQQVSSDTFSDVCGDISSPNSQLDPLDSAIIIETAGANGDCNDIQQVSDNVRRVIRLGFDASTAAIDATAIFYSLGVEVLDDGFLVVNGNTIKRYDVNLANPVDITTVTDPETVWFSEKSEDTQFVFMDGELRAINLADNTLNTSGSLWTMTAQFPPSLDCDMSTCYFVERQGDDTLTIFQVAVSGASAATPLLSGIGDISKNINGVNLTANYIFYTVRDANAVDELFRYPKAPAGGDTPVPVDSADEIPVVFTSQNTLFYYSVTNVTADSVSTKAGIVDEAMTNPQEFADSAWIGQGDIVLSYADGSMDGAMFLANAATDINFGVGGATLQSYSISSGALLSNIGEIPPEISSLNLFNSTRYGDNRFAAVATESPDTTLGYQYDMYLINPNATNVFTNLTNTSDQFEGNPELF